MDGKDRIIAQLQSENAALKELVKQLQERIAVLEKNSSNSSKPPSSDIVKPPKAVNVKPKGRRKKRKPGGQKGHKRRLRAPFDETQVDKIVDLRLDACPSCGGQLVLSSEGTKKHQQVELVEKPFLVTEYRQAWYWCEHCQCFHCADLPPDIQKTGLFGPKLIALTAYLKGRSHMSYKTLRDFFADALSLRVSTGFLAKQVRKASDAMKKPYEELLDLLPHAPHLHIDETGAKENGKRRWIWLLRAGNFTVFHVDPSRGSIVLESLLGTDFSGTISCDFWGAYKKFERMTSATLQLCWSHLIREVKFLAESKDKKVAGYGRRLLKKIQAMFSTIHRKGKDSKRVWRRKMQVHRDAILKVAWSAVPQSNDAINIAERLWNWQNEYFRFIESNIPPTNNLAEQTIRKVVIDRKVTQGARSDWGNRWLERFWSVLATCEQRGANVTSFLKNCVDALLHGRTPPQLILN
jgi:transposase